MSDISEIIVDCFSQSHLKIEFYIEDLKQGWQQVLNQADFQPVYFLRDSIDYYQEYFSGNGQKTEDFSLIVYENDLPIAIWPLMIRDAGDRKEFTSGSGSLFSPLYTSNVNKKMERNINSACFTACRAIARNLQILEWRSESYFADEQGVQEWDLNCIKEDAKLSVEYHWYLDLIPELNQIRKSYRKDSRSRSLSGAKRWSVSELNESNFDQQVWNEFQQLHLEVSGRKTRSDNSWQLQGRAIEEGSALLVYTRNELGNLNGGGYFLHSRDESYYGVGAYSRNKLPVPVSHVIQDSAIAILKARGIRWHNLGNASLGQNSYSEKEISISNFKEGFASKLFPSYHYLFELKPN